MLRRISRREAHGPGPVVFAAICVCALAGPAAPGAPQLDAEFVAQVAWPVLVTHAPGDFERLFVVTKTGRIVIVKNGSVLVAPFLDLTGLTWSDGPEQGVLGLAFHPDYESNGFFYVNYTRDRDPKTAPNENVIARYEVTADPDLADPDSAETVLIIDQPRRIHNGGWLGFGPDGYLYISSGDGGGAGDPDDNAQNLDVLLGKMLRIDINCDEFPGDPDRNYGIPRDNPFVGVGAGEIWAYGLRNPWRCSFDRETGDLYIGDVGKGGREEINFQPAGSGGGENYGWDCKEGTLCTGEATCECTDGTLVDPIFEYPHAGPPPTAVIGGYVYRGSAIPGLAGAYIFADHQVQTWRLRHDGSEVTELVEIQDEFPVTFRTTSFGEDAAGELYVCNILGLDDIYRIVSACRWDLDGDDIVGVGDLLALFANWGPCNGPPGCSGDFNSDGSVGVGDMLTLLINWGPCPS